MSHFKQNLLPKIKILTLSTIGITIAVANLVMGISMVNAWGPERPTYTNNSPAKYATFNSITDNVAVGDERNFVRIREAGTNDTYVDELEVVPGHEYEVYIYYHNDAGSETNSKGYGVATNTRMASAYPTVVNSNERGMVSGTISWSYVTPQKPNDAQTGNVWDEAYFTSSVDGVVLKYKTGTATIHNDGEANGSVLPLALFTEEGTPIGYNKLAGTIPGCAEYSGYVSYILVAENPGSSLTKQVSLDGENWSNSVNVKPGDVVTYKVAFENTGNTDFTNLILTDSHDENLSLVAGSTKIFDYQHTDGYTIEDIIDISGYNAGNVLASGLVQAIYQMQVKNDDSTCGKTLSNTITADFNSTEKKTDTTSVNVVCEDVPVPPETPPETPGTPSEIVNTGPLEIAMAAAVVIAIGGAGFYLWRTRRTLKTVEDAVTGTNDGQTPSATVSEPETPESEHTNTASPQTDQNVAAHAGFSKPAESISEPTSITANPAAPSESVESSESATPSESVEPSEPTTPSEPTEPSDSNEFNEFNDSNNQ